MHIKHFIPIPPIIAAALFANSAYGLTSPIRSCNKTTCPSNTMMLPNLMAAWTCKTYGTKECYISNGTTYVYNPCTSCDAGYTLKKIALPQQCGEAEMFMTCECFCFNCISDSGYVAAGTGYEKMVNRYCECASGTPTCKESTSYRCAKGYVGRSTNGTSGCSPCPSSGDVRGTTASAGSISTTNCYLPSGTNFSDNTGRGTYTGDCYYTN